MSPALLADLILVVHALIIVFIVAGLAVVLTLWWVPIRWRHR